MSYGSLGTIWAEMGLKYNKLVRGFEKAEVEVKRSSNKIENRVEKLNDRLNSIGSKGKRMTMSITAPLLVFGGVLAKLSGDAKEIKSRFNHVFDGMGDKARQWADSFADDFNQSESEVKSWMATLQDTLEPMGMAQDAAFGMSKSLTELTVDLSSFANVPTGQALKDLQSAMVGNHETMLKYGVIINESRLKQEAYASGIAQIGENLTDLQKIQARYNLIMKGTKKAQGDYKRTQDEITNELRATGKEAKNAAEDLGQALIPTLKELNNLVRKAIGWFNDLSQAEKESAAKKIVLAGAIAAVIGPLMNLIGLIPQVVAGLQLLQASFLPLAIGGAIVLGLAKIVSLFKKAREEAELMARSLDDVNELGNLKKRLELTKESRKEMEHLAKIGGHMNVDGKWNVAPTNPRSLKAYNKFKQEYNKLLKEEKQVKEKIKDIQWTDTVQKAEHNTLKKIRDLRAKLELGEVTERKFKIVVTEIMDNKNYSAELRNQARMELEAIKNKNGNVVIEEEKTAEQIIQEKWRVNQAKERLDKISTQSYLDWLKKQYENEKLNQDLRLAMEQEYQEIKNKHELERLEATEKIEDEINQLYMSSKDYQLYLLEQEKKAYENAGVEKQKIDAWYIKSKEKLEQEYAAQERQKQRELAKFKLNQDKSYTAEYKKLLEEQLAKAEKNSQEYINIQRDLTRIKGEEVSKQKELESNKYKFLRKLGVISHKEHLDNLKERLQAQDKYSKEWLKTQEEIKKTRMDYFDKVIKANKWSTEEQIKYIEKVLQSDKLAMQERIALEKKLQELKTKNSDKVTGYFGIGFKTEKLKEAFNDFIDNFSNLLSSYDPERAEELEGLSNEEKAQGMAKDVLPAAASGGMKIAEGDVVGGVLEIIMTLGEHLEGFQEILGLIIDNIMTFLEPIIPVLEAIMEALKPIYIALKPLMELFGRLVALMGKILLPAIKLFSKVLSFIITSIVNVINMFINFYNMTLGKLFGEIDTIGGSDGKVTYENKSANESSDTGSYEADTRSSTGSGFTSKQVANTDTQIITVLRSMLTSVSNIESVIKGNNSSSAGVGNRKVELNVNVNQGAVQVTGESSDNYNNAGQDLADTITEKVMDLLIENDLATGRV